MVMFGKFRGNNSTKNPANLARQWNRNIVKHERRKLKPTVVCSFLSKKRGNTEYLFKPELCDLVKTCVLFLGLHLKMFNVFWVMRYGLRFVITPRLSQKPEFFSSKIRQAKNWRNSPIKAKNNQDWVTVLPSWGQTGWTGCIRSCNVHRRSKTF